MFTLMSALEVPPFLQQYSIVRTSLLSHAITSIPCLFSRARSFFAQSTLVTIAVVTKKRGRISCENRMWPLSGCLLLMSLVPSFYWCRWFCTICSLWSLGVISRIVPFFEFSCLISKIRSLVYLPAMSSFESVYYSMSSEGVLHMCKALHVRLSMYSSC